MTTQTDFLEVGEDFLEHFGKMGMRWGVRNAASKSNDDISFRTNRAAKKDAEEFTRAKLFYGEGAGTRRKLIKAKVEAKSKSDSSYKKAFDQHVETTNLGKRASQAKGERKRKDVVKSTKKTARGAYHILNGNSQYASAAAALFVGGALYVHKKGIDKVVLKSGKKLLSEVRNIPQRRKDAKIVADLLRNAGLIS